MEKPAIVSVTLADIYHEQGHIDMAVAIYVELVKGEPRNDLYKKRLSALKKELKNSRKGSGGGIRGVLRKKLW